MEQESRRIVAFLGPEGSYTHQAALDAFPPSPSTPSTLSPSITIEDVFSAVQSGAANRGVVPFENSTNGSVVFTLDLLADLHNKYPDILVCGEAYVSVKHCLLGHGVPSTRTTSASSAGAQEEEEEAPDLSLIKKLYSHPQAWGQCRHFLTRHLKTAERHDVSSTSKAAEIAARDTTGESAALSSLIAAELFGLDVLAREINDQKGNSTRFFVLRRSSRHHGGDDVVDEMVEDESGGKWKSLVTFTVEHGCPGALAECLTVFSARGINLTSIYTRPSGVRNWHYVFFVEFKGRKMEGGGGGDGDGDGDGDVNLALQELDKVCRGWRWLGSWKNRLVEEEEEE